MKTLKQFVAESSDDYKRVVTFIDSWMRDSSSLMIVKNKFADNKARNEKSVSFSEESIHGTMASAKITRLASGMTRVVFYAEEESTFSGGTKVKQLYKGLENMGMEGSTHMQHKTIYHTFE